MNDAEASTAVAAEADGAAEVGAQRQAKRAGAQLEGRGGDRSPDRGGACVRLDDIGHFSSAFR